MSLSGTKNSPSFFMYYLKSAAELFILGFTWCWRSDLAGLGWIFHILLLPLTLTIVAAYLAFGRVREINGINKCTDAILQATMNITELDKTEDPSKIIALIETAINHLRTVAEHERTKSSPQDLLADNELYTATKAFIMAKNNLFTTLALPSDKKKIFEHQLYDIIEHLEKKRIVAERRVFVFDIALNAKKNQGTANSNGEVVIPADIPFGTNKPLSDVSIHNVSLFQPSSNPAHADEHNDSTPRP